MPVIKLKISTAKLPNMTKTPNTETQVLNIISYLKDIIWHLGRWESVIGGFLKLERGAPWWVQDGTFHSSHKCLKLAAFRPIEHFHICDVWETAPGCDSFHFNCCLLLFSDLFDLVKCSLGLISNRPILFPQWNNSSQDRSQLLSQRTTSPQLHSLEMKMCGPF